MQETRNWYIVHTKRNNETKLARFLAARGYKTFCPLFLTSQNEHPSDSQQMKALFSSWVFVHCLPEQLNVIPDFHAAARIVYRLNQPAVVSTEEIATLQHAVLHFKQLELVKTGIHSPLSHLLLQENAACFALPSLGYTLMAQEKVEQVYRPVWDTEEVLHDAFGMQQNKNGFILIRRFTMLVSNKVTRLSTGLFKAT